ncbi:MAG: hypothetical protein WKI04_17840 [Ferruginibacter sp.]
MSESLDYIDRYFHGQLSAAEKLLFEKRCEADAPFSDEVAFYISTRATAEVEAELEKKKHFDGLYRNRRDKKSGLRVKPLSFLTIAAAASVILFVGWVFLLDAPPAKKLADRYIKEHFQTLSPSMSSNKDSLEIGKSAFNKKNYAEAENIFNSLARDKNLHAEAIEYLGIVYLVSGKYDQAIVQFELLASDTGLQVNPGYFYQAVVLVKRNRQGDHEKAKTILKNIIRNDLMGRRQAEQWIKSF